MTNTGRATPLLDMHRELGARLTEFAGWEMPLQYEGVIAEHTAVRTGAGVFDVSHLGKLRVSGPGAGDALQTALTADVIALERGHATYSLVLAEDGGAIDDVFAYRVDDDEWLVVPNAANNDEVAGAIAASGGEPVDEWNRWAILALQGPNSYEIFESLWPGTGATELALHTWMTGDIEGGETIIARTGYTGERGFELYVPSATAPEVFRKLLDRGVTPVGLGARDTLRLEMGYALYGHELTRDINPLEAGLGWTLAWDTPFVGREALLAIKEQGVARKTFGILCRDRGVPRQGYSVTAGGAPVGELASGNFSPTLKTGIAIAIGPTATIPAVGTEVSIDARGRAIAGDIVKPPFIK